MKKKVQVKASSNFNSDLTSFGPTSEFDILEFARLNQEENKLYLYKIPIDNLYDINVNSNETFKEQQQSGRRPRFSIIEKYIKEYNLKHYAVVDMITGLYF
jgi:type-2 restriction enzyme bsp6I